MQTSDRTQFLEVVIGFAELKGKSLSAPALELFWHAMQDWDIGEFRNAAQHLIRTCPFMLTPKDFEDLRKAGRPTATESWVKAVRHASSSAYRKGPLGNELIDRVVTALGGYNAIAMCENDKMHFLERRFAEIYEIEQDTSTTRALLPNVARAPGLTRPVIPLALRISR